MTNDNGINDTVTDQEILSQVKFILRIKDTNEYDTLLLQFINDGVRLLRNNFTLVPLICQLQIDQTSLSARLPKGFYELNGTNAIRTFSSSTVNAIAPSVPVDGYYKGTFNEGATAQIIGQYINFGSGVKDDMCQIAYLGLNLDTNGNLSIPRIADLCIRWYAAAEFCLQGTPEQQNLYPVYEKRFKKQKRYIRGEYAKGDTQDNKKSAEGHNKFNFNTNTF